MLLLLAAGVVLSVTHGTSSGDCSNSVNEVGLRTIMDSPASAVRIVTDFSLVYVDFAAPVGCCGELQSWQFCTSEPITEIGSSVSISLQASIWRREGTSDTEYTLVHQEEIQLQVSNRANSAFQCHTYGHVGPVVTVDSNDVVGYRGLSWPNGTDLIICNNCNSQKIVQVTDYNTTHLTVPIQQFTFNNGILSLVPNIGKTYIGQLGVYVS